MSDPGGALPESNLIFLARLPSKNIYPHLTSAPANEKESECILGAKWFLRGAVMQFPLNSDKTRIDL